MKNVTSTYEFAKNSFKNIIATLKKVSISDMVYIRNYLSVLKKLDQQYNKMSFSARSRARNNNLIELPIAIKLIEDYKQSISSNDKKIHENVIRKIQDEITRQFAEYTKLKKEKDNYQMTLTQADALRIMLNYMEVEDVDAEILALYPEDEEELKEKNIPYEVQKESIKVNNGTNYIEKR